MARRRGLKLDVYLDDLDDPRFAAVAETAGYSVEEAWGRFLKLWAYCLKEQRFVVHEAIVRRFLGPRGVEAILQGGVTELCLGVAEEGGIYVKGSREALSWLGQMRAGASNGGKARLEAVRDDAGKFVPAATNGPALRQPYASPTPALVQRSTSPTPALVQRSPSPDPSPDPHAQRSDPPPSLAKPRDGVPPEGGGKVSRQRSRVKPGETTAEELEAAARILGKLTERNGVAYEVGRDTAHVRLIVRRMRELVERGATLENAEYQLRYIVGYCAVKLEWQGNPKLEFALRPETLFGPDTVEKYRAPAIAWVKEGDYKTERKPAAPAVDLPADNVVPLHREA